MNTAESIKQKAKNKFSWRLLGENFVFHDGEHYYKMPTFLAKNTLYRKNNSHEKVKEAHRIIEKYFWALTKIPTTKIYCDEGNNYVIKQRKINGEKLSKKQLRDNPKLLSKFKRLIIANELMWEKEGVFLDLLWSDIIAHPNTIHNLITDGEYIYVFDFGLLEKKSKNIFYKYFSKFWTWFQLQFLKKYF